MSMTRVLAVLFLGLWLAAAAPARAADARVPAAMPPEALPAPADLFPWPQSGYPEFAADSAGHLGNRLFDAPAGKHGKVKINPDGSLSFADGTPARFWGTTTVYAMTFPDTKEQIVKLADGIAANGYNMVRFHHNDLGPGIGFLNGKSSIELSPEYADRLDFFAAELIKRGVYLYVDLIDSRPYFKGENIIENFPGMQENWSSGWKGVFPHPALVAAWKKAATAFLGRTNKYTGRRWADEPAVVMVEIINENGPFWDWSHVVPSSVHQWYDRNWNEWLKKKYGTREKLAAAWTDADKVCGLFPDEDPAKGNVYRPRFTNDLEWNRPSRSRTRGIARTNDYYEHLADISRAFYAEGVKHLRSLGYSGPVTGSHEKQGPLDRWAQASTGVVNAHLYAPAAPAWKARPSSGGVQVSGVDVTSQNWFSNMLRVKVAGRAAVNGEWTGQSPTRRADVNFAVAATSAFQRLAESAHFSYGHRWTKVKMPDFDFVYNVNHEGKVSHTFSYVHDACWMLVNRVCGAMFIRGDIAPAKHTVHVAFSAEDRLEQTKHSLGLIGGPGTVGGAARFLPIIHNVECYFFDKAYDGKADVVFTTGRTAGGDYRQAKHAVILGDNPWVDHFHKARDLAAAAKTLHPQLRVAAFKEPVKFTVSWPYEKPRAVEFPALECAVEIASLPQGATAIGKSADGKYALGWLDDRFLVLPAAADLDKRLGDVEWLLRFYLAAAKRWKIATGDNAAGKTALSSDNGQFTVDWAYGTTVVDTPRTQGFSGFVGWRPENRAANLTVKVAQPYASVLATSIDGKPLAASERVLLVACGRLQNTGQENGKNGNGHYTVLKVGHGPVLLEGLRGSVALRHEAAGRLQVYALDSHGQRAGRVKATADKGELRFDLSPALKSGWFEITTAKAEVPELAAAGGETAPEYPAPKLITAAEYYASATRQAAAGGAKAAALPGDVKMTPVFRAAALGQPTFYGNVKVAAADDPDKGKVVRVQYGKVNKEWVGGWWTNLTPPAGAAGPARFFVINIKGDGTMPRDFYPAIVAGGVQYRTAKNMKSLFENDAWQTVALAPGDFIVNPEYAKKHQGGNYPATPDFLKVSRVDLTVVGPLMDQSSVALYGDIAVAVGGAAATQGAAKGKSPFEQAGLTAAPLPERQVAIPFLDGAGLKIDGALEPEFWKRARVFAMDESAVPGWHFFGTHVVGGKREKNEGGAIALAATAEGLALAVAVDKGGAGVTAENGDWWMNDCVELFTDPANKGGKPAKQVFLAYRRAGADAPATNAPKGQIARAATDGGYLLEALLPWADLGFAGVPEGEFGFDFQFDFAAPGRGRALQMAVATATNEAWIDAAHYLKGRVQK